MPITVVCPQCQYELHLPNSDFLGRKAKCPGCEHKFIMEKPKPEKAEPEKPKPAEPDVPKTPASKADAKPKPKGSPKPKPKQQPKSAPARPTENEDLTVYSSGKTNSEPSPIRPPKDVEFQTLKDPGADAAEEKHRTETSESPTLDGSTPSPLGKASETGESQSDSALVPEGIWDDIIESLPEAPAGEKRSREAVARCPHCHAGVNFRQDADLQDCLCPHCERRFNLIPPDASPKRLAMPDKVGIYSLKKHPRIGVGPFGNVYRAKDGESQDPIVIKVSRGGEVNEKEMSKFLATLRSVMQLKHANIAAVRELDQADDRVYLVSRFITGLDLSEYLLGTPGRQLSMKEIASLCALIASVLHHAHKFGVVHGNLKPTNIRLDGNQRPFLLDFGLANRQNRVRVTDDGRIVGTASYLAPEQLPGHLREPDAQTDVFALGAIFYELLAGRRPFPGEGPELFKQIAAGGPPHPRSLNPEVPNALDIICMKCLEVDPRDRYQSAMELYKELRLYLENKPIQTKPPGLIKRIGRWCRRRPIVGGMLLVFLLLTAAGAGFLGWQFWQTGGFS